MGGTPGAEKSAVAERELLGRFILGDVQAEHDLAAALKPALMAHLGKYWRGGKDEFQELLGVARLELWDLRAKGALAPTSLAELCPRLIARQRASARRTPRYLSNYRTERRTLAERPAAPDALADSRRLLTALTALAATLPGDAAGTFQAMLAEEHGTGPALPEALGISSNAAHARRTRLRQALLAKAVAAGLVRTTADGGWEVVDDDV